MVNIHTTRWTALCGCTMEYEWDADVPDDQRVHYVTNVSKRCNQHPKESTANDQEHHDKVLEESKRWNFTLKTLAANFLAIFTTTDSHGSVIIKPGISLDWTFSGTFPDRILTCSLVGVTLNANQKQLGQQKIDQLFGPGKVILL